METGGMRKIFGLAGKIMSGLITAVLVFLLAAVMLQKVSGKLPGIFGYHIMYVLTGSMEPEIMAGDAVLVRECGAEDVKTGDVICYVSTSGIMAGKMITHKVVTAPYEQDGELWLQTQGTANPVPDDPITAEQVYGKVLCRLTVAGKLYRFFCTVPGLIAVTVPILLIIYEGIRNIINGTGGEEPEDTEEGPASGKTVEETKEETEKSVPEGDSGPQERAYSRKR